MLAGDAGRLAVRVRIPAIESDLRSELAILAVKRIEGKIIVVVKRITEIRILNFDILFEVCECTAERARERRMVRLEQRPDALVVERVRTRSDEECLSDGDTKEA